MKKQKHVETLTVELIIAFSYLRFSDLAQASGDSIRRQTQLRDDWLAKHPEVRLDTSVTLHDLGRSAFTGAHRENPDRHALAVFLKLVEAGRVPRGSYLLIENLDRLSREEEVPACHLLTALLMAGIRVVQLSPYEMVLTDKSNGWELMRAVMELSRGHGESAMKSERVGGAWAEKKRRAGNGEKQKPTERMGDGCEVLTRRLPTWVEERGGKLHLIPAKAKAVRLVFRLAGRDGLGVGAIAKRLNADGVPPLGHAGGWIRSYVYKILTNRAVLGEYQPHTRRGGKRRPEGDPVPGYFPRVIEDDEWNAARAATDGRKLKGGRPAKGVNLWTGIVHDARDGGRVHVKGNGPKSGGPTLVSANATHGASGDPVVSFPLATFDAAVLSMLREIDPAEVLGEEKGPDEVSALSGELGAVEAEIAKLEADLDRNGLSDALARALRRKEARKAELVPLLKAAEQKAATPLSAAWGECKSLLGAIEEAPDLVEARTRLRAAIRRVVESAWLLTVPLARDRLAAVQLWFHGGRCRSYVIRHRPGFANAAARRESSWQAWSLAEAGLSDAIDLRDREQAERLAAALVAGEARTES